jgi:hypothetical protein
MHAMRKKRRGAKRVLLASISTLLCLLAAEAVLRSHTLVTSRGSLEEAYEKSTGVPPAGKPASFGEMVRPSNNPRIIYELKPGLDVVFKGAVTRTNSAGWREDEIPLAKPPGTIRIVGIGDSHMFGWGVEVGGRYMDLIEKGLNEAHPQRKWQSVVFAAPGYNLDAELAALEQYGLRYEPDLIVYGFVLNDRCLPSFILDRPSFWAPRSFIVDYAYRAIATSKAKSGTDDPALVAAHSICEPDQAPPAYRAGVGKQGLVSGFKRLARIGEERSIPVIVLVTLRDSVHRLEILEHKYRWAKEIPWLKFYSFREAVSKWLSSRGHPGYIKSPLALSDDDAHPSAVAHALKARLFVEEMTTSGLAKELVEGSDR